jgi:hypothetical protein
MNVSRKLKVAMLLLGLALVIVFVLWYPYESGNVPEWKLQVVDQHGKAAVGAQVNQEWLDPIDDGIVDVDSGTTDANGFVLFRKRALHNRLALGVRRSGPSAHVFICWQDQYGDAFWDDKHRLLDTQLVLKKGSCPYG